MKSSDRPYSGTTSLRLTGEYATEVSDASGTGLFNVRERKWSNPLLDTLEIPKRWMPKCFESIEVSGKVTDSISDFLRLPGGLPVVGSGGDSVIQTLGVWSDFNEAVKLLQMETLNDPDKKNYALYELLKDSFKQITEYENLIRPVPQEDINR